ncbi:MAG: CBS domain-containing protein [Candidatus Binatia bacterium]|nr:CBS domain-containing protein [Candidatus Binatia bacterium]
MTRLAHSAETTLERLRPVARTALDSTIFDAAHLMYESGTDALAVVDANQQLVGVLGARDIVAVLGLGLEPARLTVRQWLQSPRECNNHGPRGEAWLG